MLVPIAIFLLIVFATGQGLWSLRQMRRLQHNLQHSRMRDEAHRRFINHFIHKLATATEVAEAMSIVVSQVCEDLGAESVGIFVPLEGTANAVLQGSACTGFFPIFTVKPSLLNVKVHENARYRAAYFHAEQLRAGDGPLGQVVISREPLLWNKDPRRNQDDAQFFPREVRSLMALPLMVEQHFVGIICAVNRRRGNINPFTEEDLAYFQEQSSQPALACSLVVVYADRQRQDRIRREVEFCGTMQSSMLPQVPPRWAELAFAVYYQAAFEVSGDSYDFIPIDDDRLLIVVADAAGKGMPACLMSSMSHSFVRGTISHYTTLNEFMLNLNHLIYSNSDDSHYITMNLLLIDRRDYGCEFGCAGHTPLLLRQADGSCQALKPAGPALGMWPNELLDNFETATFTFTPGMAICLFTDGFPEALNKNHEEFGLKQLQKLWRGAPGAPDAVIQHILSTVRHYCGEEPQSDDQTLFVIKRKTDR
jgi:sigma-B regulation protein RsbU (phosphoserine phosphatase)